MVVAPEPPWVPETVTKTPPGELALLVAEALTGITVRGREDATKDEEVGIEDREHEGEVGCMEEEAGTYEEGAAIALVAGKVAVGLAPPPFPPVAASEVAVGLAPPPFPPAALVGVDAPAGELLAEPDPEPEPEPEPEPLPPEEPAGQTGGAGLAPGD